MSNQLVSLKGGRVAAEADLLRLFDFEKRGVHFTLADDGRVRVRPSAGLSDDDRQFLTQHHDLVVYLLTVRYTDSPEGATA